MSTGCTSTRSSSDRANHSSSARAPGSSSGSLRPGPSATGSSSSATSALPPKGGFTYGLKRAEILSALANGVTLVVLGALIVAEAIRRLVAPVDVGGRAILAVALTGIAVNVAASLQVARANRRSLNVEGSL